MPTIYTNLYKDNLNGSRIVTKDNCVCKLFNIKRSDVDFLQSYKEELQTPALYILLNRDENKAYIGETDDFYTRLQQHMSKKDFWNEALAFAASDDSLGKTEVQYLEYLAFNKASHMRSYDLSENTQVPKSSHINVIQREKADGFFNYVQFMTKFVGCNIFETNSNNIQHSPMHTVKPIIEPIPIELKSEDLKGKVYMSLNGEGKYSKREMVLQIVKEFVKQYPNATFDELKATFKRDYLQRFSQFEFLEPDIERAKNWKEFGEDHIHYFLKDDDILVSGDGVEFAVCVEWDKNNIINVLGIAKALGWDFEKVKKVD